MDDATQINGVVALEPSKMNNIPNVEISAFGTKSDRWLGALVLFLAALLSLAFPIKSHAVPVLQLDIIDGEYLQSTETIVSYKKEFSVVAYGKVSDIDLNETHYLSIAIAPKIGPDPVDIGSFNFEGTTYTIDDLVYGVPPLEANLEKDGKDMGSHDVFETYFLEYAFQFSASQTRSLVNTQDTPGTDPTQNSGDDLYYMVFDGDILGLKVDEGYSLHFDLYNTQARNGDTDIKNFAPFSHDAEVVPEPQSLVILLMGLGLLLVTMSGRRSSIAVRIRNSRK